MSVKNNSQQSNIRINFQIKAPQVRVISDNNSEIMDTKEAIKLAQEQGVDLVEVNGKSFPPIVKIIDIGKYKYELKKKDSESKKNQKIQEVKEIGLSPNIEEHDLNHKLESVKKFLSEGHRVKFCLRFKGREMAHIQVGKKKMEWIIKQLSDLIIPNPQISMEGKFMFLTVLPGKK